MKGDFWIFVLGFFLLGSFSFFIFLVIFSGLFSVMVSFSVCLVFLWKVLLFIIKRIRYWVENFLNYLIFWYFGLVFF